MLLTRKEIFVRFERKIFDVFECECRGRRRACVTYCITYILSCITKHSPEYKVLMLGRILGGIATSLLFSAFESWLVAEHNKVIVIKLVSTLYSLVAE